jgi:DivIVA domain-containing protein
LHRPNDRKDERMDWKDIDRLRDPNFTVARRGYDQREVDRYLGSLVDWLETDAATELGDLVVKRKLEHVGKSAARILVTTEEEAVKLRRLTDEQCAKLRADAEAEAQQARQSANEYAENVRAKADEDARRATETASARAQRMVEDGERRRAEIDAIVGELESRRENTIKQLDRLRAELSSTLGPHEPAAEQPPKPKKAGAVVKT